MIKSRKGQEGFTLIELLVVVLIIGILAAIAIPAFLGQKKGAQDSNAKSLLRNAAIAMESFYSENQDFAPNSATLDLDLTAIEPNMDWTPAVAGSPQAKADEIEVTTSTFGVGAPVNRYILHTISASGVHFSYTRNENARVAKCKGAAVAALGAGADALGCAANQW